MSNITNSQTGVIGNHAHVEGGIHFHTAPASPLQALLPPLPSLIIGREQAMHDLKVRLGILPGAQPSPALQILTAIRGWPGVGKTTIATALAHDPEVAQAFPDGTL